VKEILENTLKIRFENINPNDLHKLYDIRHSIAHTSGFLNNKISEFQFLYTDGKQQRLVKVLEHDRVERKLYDDAAKFSDDYLKFDFWNVKNGEAFFHHAKNNTTELKTDDSLYILEFHKILPDRLFNLTFYWLSGVAELERKIKRAISETIAEAENEAPIFIDDLSAKLHVSAETIGRTLQRLGVLTKQVWDTQDKRMRRRLAISNDALKRICQLSD